MITIPIGPQNFSREFLNGQGHFAFDLPGGLNAAQPFASTVTEVLTTAVAADVDKSGLTFGNASGLAMTAAMSAGAATEIELVWPGRQSEFATTYQIEVPSGRVGARFHLEGQASGAFSGRVPLPAALSNFDFGLKVGTQVGYDRYIDFDAGMASGALLLDLVTHLALPQGAGSPSSLPKFDEVLVLSYGGFLDLTAGLSSGYELIGHHGLTLHELKAAVEYGLRLKASINVGYQLGGRFEISSRLGATPGWVRLTVRKGRTAEFDFAEAFVAKALAAVTGLPDSADEFLSAVLGADVRRALEVFEKIRVDTDLDMLQQDVDKILAQTVANLANKWIGRAIDRTNVKAFQAAASQVVDEAHAGDPDITAAVVHLYQDALSRNDVDGLGASLAKVTALGSLDDLAHLDDSAAWQIITRFSGGSPTALLTDPATFGHVQAVATAAAAFVKGSSAPHLRDLVEEITRNLRPADLFSALGRYASKDRILGLTDLTLQAVTERLLGMGWDQIKNSDVSKVAADLHAALENVNTFKNTWYTKLSDALQRSFAFSANVAYSRAVSSDALVDVEIDVSGPTGQQLFQQGSLGQLSPLFDLSNLGLVRLHHGVLTHELTDSTHVEINVLDWAEANLVQVLSRTTDSIEVGATGLVNVFTTEASVTERVANKGYALESRFLMTLAGSSVSPLDPSARAAIVRSLDRVGVSYDLAVSDAVTTTAQLTQYLELAEYLRLIPSAGTYATSLASQFPEGLGSVTATYVARYAADTLFRAFQQTDPAALRELVGQASRRLVSAHLIRASIPQSDLVTMGFAYLDPANAALYDREGYTAFQDANSTVVIPGWFTGGAPKSVSLPARSFIRLVLMPLYALEQQMAERLAHLDNLIDTARSQRAPVTESDLEAAARAFVASSADINTYGTITTFFGIFDAFVQAADLSTRPASTLILQITPARSQTPVTKYLMSR